MTNRWRGHGGVVLVQPLVLLVLLALLHIAPDSHGDVLDEVSAARAALRRAETLRQVAVAADGSLRYQRLAVQQYERAITHARRLPAHRRQPWLRMATFGAARGRWQAHAQESSIRNRLPHIWSLRGNHSKYSGSGSSVDLALANALDPLVKQLNKPDGLLPPLLVRCRADKVLCVALRFAAQDALGASGKVAPVPDHRLALRLAGPEGLGPVGQVPPVAARTAVSALTRAEAAILVDLDLRDTGSSPHPVARMRVLAWRWSLSDGKLVALGDHSGVGLGGSAGSRAAPAVVLVGLLLCALAGLVRKPYRGGAALAAAVAMAGYAGGALLLTVAARVTDPLLPRWDGATYSSSGWPAPEAWVWSAAHGSVTFGVPLLLCLALPLVARSRGMDKAVQPLHWGNLLAPIQLGALTVLVLPLVQQPSIEGLIFAAAATGSALVLGLVARDGLDLLFHGGTSTRPPVLPLALSLAGLLTLLPALVGMPSPWIALTAAVVLFLVHLGVARSQKPSDSDVGLRQGPLADSASAEVGDMRQPAYVAAGERDPSNVIDAITATRGLHLVHVTGPSGSGKTRFVDQLVQQLGDLPDQPWLVGRALGHTQETRTPAAGSGACSSRPYSVMADLLRGVVDIEGLQASYAVQQRIASAANQVGGALDALPGVGLVLGLLDSDKVAQMSAQRLVMDVIQAVEQRVQQQPLVLVIDDYQSADGESCELLQELCSHFAVASREPDNPLILAVCSTTAGERGTSAPVVPLDRLHVVELDDLDRQGLALFLRAAGMEQPSPELVDWFDSIARLPADVLEVLRSVVHSELVVCGSDGDLVVPDLAALMRAKGAMPRRLIDHQKERLALLNAEPRLLLEMAALCGRRFTAQELAAGLNMTRLAILERLRQIELQHGVIQDVEQEDLFVFESETTRQALLQLISKQQPAQGEAGAGARQVMAELAREFHFQAASALVDAWDSGDRRYGPVQLFHHCDQAGARLDAQAARFAVHAAEAAAALFTWQETLRWCGLARRKSTGIELPQQSVHQLEYAEARALRGQGGQRNRERAVQLLRGLVDSPAVDQVAVVQDACEALYEEKQVDELRTLREWIERLRARDDWRRPLAGLVLQFYAVLVDEQLAGHSRRQQETVARLEQLAGELRELPADLRRDLLLARVLQEVANGIQSADNRQRVERLCQESLTLKRRHGDLNGQAITLGTLGSFHLYTTGDLVEARGLLGEDLELVRRMGDRAAEGGVLNKLGLCRFKMAQREERADQRSEHLGCALDLAQNALELARELDRELDTAFAAVAVVEYVLAEQGQDKQDPRIEEALAVLDDGDLWGKVPPRPRAYLHSKLDQLLPGLSSAGLGQTGTSVVHLSDPAAGS